MNKFYSMLGIARKAGLVEAGETASTFSLKRQKSYLIIIAEDASDNTKKKFIKLSNQYKVSYFIVGEKEKIGEAIGKEIISVVTITNNQFADKLIEIIS